MLKRLLLAAAIGAAVLVEAASADADGSRARDDLVYVQTNDPAGNELLVLAGAPAGRLKTVWRLRTGGEGNGMGLGSQGSVTLSEDRLWLVVVNAGSNEISLFFVGWAGRPILLDVAPSGGTTPISATIREGLVYVVNSENVSGLKLGWRRWLEPIAGSTQPLSAPGSMPAQVSFTPDGEALIVTEKGTGCIDRFALDDRGRAGPLTCFPSSGMTPFGFAFREKSRRGDEVLIVSEAVGGAPDASTVSSYALDDGEILPISPMVPTTETAACWIAVTPDGRFAYSTNTGSGSVSGFAVDRVGELTLLDDDGVTGVTGGASIDAAVSRDGRRLYVLDDRRDAVVVFRILHDGGLTVIGEKTGLPATAAGLAVR